MFSEDIQSFISARIKDVLGTQINNCQINLSYSNSVKKGHNNSCSLLVLLLSIHSGLSLSKSPNRELGSLTFFSKNANKISSVGSSRIGVLQVHRIRNQDLRKDHCSR